MFILIVQTLIVSFSTTHNSSEPSGLSSPASYHFLSVPFTLCCISLLSYFSYYFSTLYEVYILHRHLNIIDLIKTLLLLSFFSALYWIKWSIVNIVYSKNIYLILKKVRKIKINLLIVTRNTFLFFFQCLEIALNFDVIGFLPLIDVGFDFSFTNIVPALSSHRPCRLIIFQFSRRLLLDLIIINSILSLQ